MLSTINDRLYENTSLLLDGRRFVRCRFVNCQLIYEGGEDVDFEECSFEGCSWIFGGPAERTIGFFATLYQRVGAPGQELVQGVFESIRDGRLSEVRADEIVAGRA